LHGIVSGLHHLFLEVLSSVTISIENVITEQQFTITVNLKIKIAEIVLMLK